MASRPKRSCTQAVEYECNWDEEEDEFVPDKQEEQEDKPANKKRGRGEVEAQKKSERSSSARVTSYREASSDDEFAKEHFILPSSRAKRAAAAKEKELYFDEDFNEDLEEPVKTAPRSKKTDKQRAKTSVDGDDDEEDAGMEMGDEIEYRIQWILGKKFLTPTQWRALNEKYTTVEVTKGSVWQQPDEEYFDTTDVPLEKFCIKWAHASYLHCSWETEKDLMDNVGPAAKMHIKKFRMREYEGRELFEDLAKGEYFPFNYLQIERILDVDDPEVNMYSVDWESAAIPPHVAAKKNTLFTEVAATAVEGTADEIETATVEVEKTVDVAEQMEVAVEKEHVEVAPPSKEAVEDNEEIDFAPRRSYRSSRKREVNFDDDEEPAKEPAKRGIQKHLVHGKKQKLCQYLHGGKCYVTVKWEGLPYSDVSFELLDDIIARGVDYEMPLRRFYGREQKSLYCEAQKKNAARKLVLDQTIMGSNSTIPDFPGGTLRDYQWEGVRWMLFNLLQGRNCILADEMGLGKTIQSSALLQMVKNHQKSAGPFLVVAPLSTIVNWQREVSAWTNLDVTMYYGSQEDRDLIRSYEFKYLDSKNQGYKVEVVITTPETCVAYDDKSGNGKFKRELSRIPWDLIIVDEAHKLKNYDSKLSSTLRDEYSFKNCVLLTGTPLQNNTDELWSLLNFVAEEDFADREAFIEQFGELKSSEQLEALHKRIKPYLLRREKEHVEKTVPPKEEIVIEVELTAAQKQYYRAIYEQKTGFLYKSGTKDGPSLSNLAMELRKCCNHPFLIKGAQHELSKHFSNSTEQDILTQSSGKMTLLDKLLPKLHKDGHRVLIFSQFRMMLDLIEDYLHGTGYCYERVDGSIVGKQRQASIDRYMNNSNIFVMLLSTKAGGVGINLTAADTVIIFDSDWNPQNDIQAQARAHRIGQTKAVTVYRLLTKKTYEMVMFKAASIKLGLDYAVMHNLGNSQVQLPAMPSRGKGRRNTASSASTLEGISTDKADHVSSLSKRELENLLKHGAYDMFIEDREGTGDAESKRFVEESIEQILERSSIFTHKEDEAERKCQQTKSMNFAKASFVSADNCEENNEVAIDDPDFWSKVIGLSVEEEQDGVNGKRKCRQLIDSYKEPTNSIRSIYGSFQNAYVTDSEPSDVDDKPKKRRKKSNELVPADFTSDNLQTVFNAMLNHGYGQWEQIRKVTKLRWFSHDFAKACRLGVLNLLLLSSCVCDTTDLNKTLSSEGGNEDISSADKAEDEETPVTMERTESTSKLIGTIIFDASLLLQNLKKYKLSKLALKLLVDFDRKRADADVAAMDLSAEEQDVDAKVMSALFADLQKLCDNQQLLNSTWKETFDRHLFTNEVLRDDSDASLQNVIALVQSLPELATFFVFESDPVKIQKRTMNSRGKLAQLEDLFEASMFVALSDRINPPQVDSTETLTVAPTATATTADDENVEGNDNTNAEAVVGEEVQVKVSPVLTMPASMEMLIDISDNMPAWWCKMYDSALLQSVAKYGWPEGKRKLSNIMNQLGQLPCNDGTTETMTSVLTPKFILNRCKAMARYMRYSEEDVAAAAKVVAAAKASAKQQMKKNAMNVLRNMQKMGYPRTCYDTIIEDLSKSIEDENTLTERCSHLLTWDKFAKECNMSDSITDLKDIVHSAIEAFNKDCEAENVSIGVLEDIPMKLVKAAFDKSDIIHHIRLTLALNDEAEIHRLIDDNCKGTGPSVPVFRRDMTMPVWWKQAHDVSLLRLCLVYGYGQWKAAIVDPLVNTAPDDFVIPPKVNGVEWALQLTTRSAEKRVLALLRGMPQLKNIPLPPPSSPQKKGSVQQVTSLPSVNKSMFWFKQQSTTPTATTVVPSETAVEQKSVAVVEVDSKEDSYNIIKSIPLDTNEVEVVEASNPEVVDLAVSSEPTSPPAIQCTGDSYIEVLNAVRDDPASKEQRSTIIDISEEMEVASVVVSEVQPETAVVVDVVEVKSKPAEVTIVVETPAKQVTEPSAAIDTSKVIEVDVHNTSLQTPKDQTTTDSKAKKASKVPAKPVNNGKSIMSFFKKAQPEGTA